MHRVKTTEGAEVDVLDRDDLDSAKNWMIRQQWKLILFLFVVGAGWVASCTTLKADVAATKNGLEELKAKGTIPGEELRREVDSLRQASRQIGKDVGEAKDDIRWVRDVLVRQMQERNTARGAQRSSDFPRAP